MTAGDESVGDAGHRLVEVRVDLDRLAVGSLGLPLVEHLVPHEEGLRLGPQKLCRQGRENSELIEIIRWNVRVPEKVIGDLRAQLAANHVGAQRILGVLTEKGWSSLAPLGHELIDRTERAMRQAIGRIPEGAYTYGAAVDRHREEPIVIRVAVEVKAGALVVDYAGT